MANINANQAAFKLLTNQTLTTTEQDELREKINVSDAVVDYSNLLTLDGDSEISAPQKAALAVQWPEAVADLSDEELMALGYFKLEDGKIPVSYLPSGVITPQLVLDDRADYSYMPLTGQSLAEGNGGGAVVTVGSVSSFVLAFEGNPKATSYGSLSDLVENILTAPFGSGAGETGLAQAGLQIIDYATTEGATPGPAYIGQVTAKGSARLNQLVKTSEPTFGLPENLYNTFYLPPLQAAATLANSQGKTIGQPIVFFRQGEDSTAQRALWKTEFEQYRGEMMADANALFSKSYDLKMVSYQTGTKTSSGKAAATLAQWDSFKTNYWHTISSPTYPIYGQLLYRTDDKIHLTSAGYAWLGAYEGKAASKFLYGDQKYCTYPLSANASGWVVTVNFSVPVPPLVLDITDWEVQDFGFKVIDDAGSPNLSNFQVSSPTQITFETDRAISTNAKLRYGVDYDFNTPVVANPVSNGISGNLRDSDPETVTIGGVPRALYNWCLQSDIDVNEDVTPPFPAEAVWVTNTDNSSYSAVYGTGTLTELESPPSFDADSMTVLGTNALSTGILPTASFAMWCVFYHDPADTTRDDSILFGNKDGAFADDGFLLLRGSDRVSLVSPTGGSRIVILENVAQWVFAGVTFDGTNTTVFTNVDAAVTTGGTSTGAVNAGIALTPAVELGKGSYTGGTAGEPVDYALVGYANQYLDSSQRAEVISDAVARLAPVGITILP